ncbi:MAG: T9SS type A sorting domain-containing protein, partial [Bacteroidota bacterium]
PLQGEGKGGGAGWDQLAFVQGSGTSSVQHVYTYNDAVPSAGKFQYRLEQIDHDGNFAYSPTVEVNVTLTPDDYTLSQNYPNPFNPSTKIQFALASTQFAEVKVFNSLGEEVKTLFSGIGEAGVINEVEFDGKEFASGVYFYSLTADGRHEIKKMLLLK